MDRFVAAPSYQRDTPAHRAGGRFYVGIAVSMIALSVAGFVPSIIMPAHRTAPLSQITSLIAAHASASIAWLATYLAQALLVASGRLDAHRRLGVLGVMVAFVFLATGCLTVVEEARRGFDLSGDTVARGTMSDPSTILSGPIAGLAAFTVLLVGAVWYRRRPEVHKRLMTMAMLGTAASPMGHLVGHLHADFGVVVVAMQGVTLLPFLLVLHDWMSQRRVHPASLWGAIGVYVFTVGFFFLIAPTPGWRALCRWLVI